MVYIYIPEYIPNNLNTLSTPIRSKSWHFVRFCVFQWYLFRRFAARQFSVRLGDVDFRRDDEPSSPVNFKVSEIRAHKQFSRVGFYNDIAILKLDKPARKSKYIIPLCLPPQQLRNEKFAGKKTTVVGWGTTYYGGKESTVQRQAVLPIWRNEDCNDAYFQPITANFICAGYSQGGTDACQVI